MDKNLIYGPFLQVYDWEHLLFLSFRLGGSLFGIRENWNSYQLGKKYSANSHSVFELVFTFMLNNFTNILRTHHIPSVRDIFTGLTSFHWPDKVFAPAHYTVWCYVSSKTYSVSWFLPEIFSWWYICWVRWPYRTLMYFIECLVCTFKLYEVMHHIGKYANLDLVQETVQNYVKCSRGNNLPRNTIRNLWDQLEDIGPESMPKITMPDLLQFQK